MPKTLNESLPWIAIALALAVGVAYYATRPQPETYETCMTRLARTSDGDADRALNRAACAEKPGAPQGSPGPR
jgi:hypothetical protein